MVLVLENEKIMVLVFKSLNLLFHTKKLEVRLEKKVKKDSELVAKLPVRCVRKIRATPDQALR